MLEQTYTGADVRTMMKHHDTAVIAENDHGTFLGTVKAVSRNGAVLLIGEAWYPINKFSLSMVDKSEAARLYREEFKA